MLLWPDTSIVRFFFQNKLELRNTRDLKVIEFGCGSGANLLPFIHAGWQVFGVDINSEAGLLDRREKNQVFICHDLNLPLPEEICNGKFDVVLLPQILCYLTFSARQNLLKWTFDHLNEDGLWFLTERADNDYRALNSALISELAGSKIAKISFSETGETGQEIRFWDKHTLLENLSEIFNEEPSDFHLMSYQFENLSQGIIVQNSDFHVWGHR
jgi:SAM-dependent methyltransferase